MGRWSSHDYIFFYYAEAVIVPCDSRVDQIEKEEEPADGTKDDTRNDAGGRAGI